MNVFELRTELATLLANDLGKYRNNQPSIWVYGSSSQPPSQGDGLECLIKEQPSVAAKASSGGQKIKYQKWEILLRNWTKSSKLSLAIQKIEKRFVVSSYNHLPALESFLEQAKVYIFDPIILNL
jgi:hypothetical protein